MPKDLLREYGPGWTLQLLTLCSSSNAHAHGGVPCQAPGKIPLVPKWQMLPDQRRQDGLRPEAVAAEMAQHLEQGGNIGIAVPAGCLVLDADSKEAAARVAAACPDAPLQRTAAGVHVVTRLPTGRSITNTCKRELEPGLEVDLRGQGSQIVCWPSVHHTGAEYVWERSLPETRAELPPTPDAWLTSLVNHHRRNGGREPGEWARVVRNGVTEGSRHSTLLSVAGKLFASNLPPMVAYELAHAWNVGSCRPPLPHEEADRAICDVATKELGSHSGVKMEGQKFVV